ncbi:hypothetical protein [Streptomyces sp. BK79]|uniref:hypothetical protein n=1 Tax=Streptomyces sp. BK79 TaxID=3350097 RepID=UPI00376F934F
MTAPEPTIPAIGDAEHLTARMTEAARVAGFDLDVSYARVTRRWGSASRRGRCPA